MGVSAGGRALPEAPRVCWMAAEAGTREPPAGRGVLGEAWRKAGQPRRWLTGLPRLVCAPLTPADWRENSELFPNNVEEFRSDNGE